MVIFFFLQIKKQIKFSLVNHEPEAIQISEAQQTYCGYYLHFSIDYAYCAILLVTYLGSD